MSPAVAAVTDAVIIINPVCGPTRRGSAAKRVEIAKRTFDSLRASAEIRLTEYPDHAYELAQDAVKRGIGTAIAWGGDGTVNEVARAVAHTSTALGIVPGGSGNGFARELGIPFSPAKALERAIRSPGRTIDAGEIDGRTFVNIAGIGLDAHVAGVVATQANHRGLLPYLLAATKGLLTYRAITYSIDVEGETFDTSALIVAIANSRQYGFQAHVAPTAVVDDGLLDLVVIEDRSVLGNLARLPALFVGGIHHLPGVMVSRVRHVTVRARAPMLFHVDGEATQGGTELVARVHAGALRVRA